MHLVLYFAFKFYQNSVIEFAILCKGFGMEPLDFFSKPTFSLAITGWIASSLGFSKAFSSILKSIFSAQLNDLI